MEQHDDFSFREGEDVPSAIAFGGFLLSLAQVLKAVDSQPAAELLDRWRQQIEDLIAREPYLTLKDEEDIREMYNQIRRRVLE